MNDIYSLHEEAGCDDSCLEHSPECDGFCDHSEHHKNACLEVTR